VNYQSAVDILLVEDNAEDAELTIRALKKHKITDRFLHFDDGVEAMDFIFCRGKYAQREIQNHPKVILLDIKLPKLSGLELLRAIKSDNRTRTIPVVMVTSSQQDADIKLAYEYEANSYVVKPIDFQTFAEAINQLGIYWLTVNQDLKHQKN
jgi:two-component system, response regulator